MWHTPTHNDLYKKSENDVGRQVPSKQDDDAVLDGDKKAVSTQLHNSVIYKLCILFCIILQSIFCYDQYMISL